MIINVDRKTRNISLSSRPRIPAEESRSRAPTRVTTTVHAGLAGLGALLSSKQDSNKAEWPAGGWICTRVRRTPSRKRRGVGHDTIFAWYQRARQRASLTELMARDRTGSAMDF